MALFVLNVILLNYCYRYANSRKRAFSCTKLKKKDLIIVNMDNVQFSVKYALLKRMNAKNVQKERIEGLNHLNANANQDSMIKVTPILIAYPVLQAVLIGNLQATFLKNYFIFFLNIFWKNFKIFFFCEFFFL